MLPDSSAFRYAVFLLPKSKTGNNRVVRFTNPLAISAVCRLRSLLSVTPDWRLPSLSNFNKCLKKALDFLGLQEVDITSHGFRRGGATNDYVDGRSISEIMEAGGWKTRSSLEHYITLSQFLLAEVPRCTNTLSMLANNDPYRYLNLQQNV